ncbi:unnamed protein product [Brachionus calyciflorus]|nr:unnamed protein product [Brachionus calyciflorus]
MGAQILDDVLEDLFQSTEISQSSLVLLTGVSAGGIGVLMNANRIKQKFDLKAPQTKLKVIIDSSWQLDLPYSYLCNQNECPMNRVFKNSIKYWNSQIPNECARQETNSLWNCFLPNKIIPFIQLPVFIIQSKFDESQLLEQYNQVEMNQKDKSIPLVETFKIMDFKLRKSLSNVTTYFITSCLNHMIITRDDWNYFKIDDLSLSDAIYKWAMSENEIDLDNFKKIDECSFPDCQGECPSMRHPETNKIINSFDYVKYLGLISYESIGKWLNLSELNVKKMSYFKLMKLLMY